MDATTPTTDTTTGLLLLDIDGVLNPGPKRAERPPGYRTERIRTPHYRGGHHDLTVWFNPEHGPVLRELSARTGLQLVWCSQGWSPEDANTVFGPWLGLPELPTVRFDRTFAFDVWKYHDVSRFLDTLGTPRFAWLDDDFRTAACTAPAATTWFRRVYGDRCLLVEVDHHHGVLPHHLERVERWAAT